MRFCSANASSIAFRASSASAMDCLTSLAALPSCARLSAESLPIVRRIAVNAPFLPKTEVFSSDSSSSLLMFSSRLSASSRIFASSSSILFFSFIFSNQRNLFRKINQAHPSLRDECAFLVVPPCFTARNVPNASAKLRSQTATVQGCLKKTLSGLTRQRLHICPGPNPLLSVNEPEEYRQT